ncbi:MAG: SMEK domain-containing protein, partial [Clostridiales bacterium]|nr:SMEK domain-containing protein [Clostridiales bacterium]
MGYWLGSIVSCNIRLNDALRLNLYFLLYVCNGVGIDLNKKYKNYIKEADRLDAFHIKRLKEDIELLLNTIPGYIKTQNQKNLTDFNSYCEDLFKDLLNFVFTLDLQNLNSEGDSHYPVIDLGDRQNRVCYQITSQNDRRKIKNTINRFQEKQLYKEY